jgi:hypothetical protein
MVEPCKIEDGNCFVRCLEAVYRAFGIPITSGDVIFGRRAATPYYVRPPGPEPRVGTLRFKYASFIFRGMRDEGPVDMWIEQHPDAGALVASAAADLESGVFSIAMLNAVHLPYTSEYHVRPGGLFGAPHTAIVAGGDGGGGVRVCDPTIFPRSLEPRLEHISGDDFARALSDSSGIPSFVPFARICLRLKEPAERSAPDLPAMRRSAVASFVRDHDVTTRGERGGAVVVGGAGAILAYVAEVREALCAGAAEAARAALDRLFVLIFHFFRFTRRSLPEVMRGSGVAGADALASEWTAAYDAWERLAAYLFLVSKHPTPRRLDQARAAVLDAHALETSLVARMKPYFSAPAQPPEPLRTGVDECTPTWSQFRFVSH